MQTPDPRIVRSRAIIVTAARTHFIANGYVGANVDEIAAEAGVSKRTIYNVFGGKEQLFRATLNDAIDAAERFSEDIASVTEDDVTTQLTATAVRLASTVLGGRVVPLRRLLIGEAQRFPEIAREYHVRAPGRVLATLATLFAELARRGSLKIDTPELAAEHFAFLIMGARLDEALFTPETPEPAEVEATARAGAAAFLRAYT